MSTMINYQICASLVWKETLRLLPQQKMGHLNHFKWCSVDMAKSLTSGLSRHLQIPLIFCCSTARTAGSVVFKPLIRCWELD